MSYSWKKLSDVFNGRPYFLENDDLNNCYIAREYISRGGYNISDTNNLVQNFKMGCNVEDKRLYYRTNAIKQFANELLELFRSDNFKKQTIIVIPSSKIKSDPKYDDRMDKVCEILKENEDIQIQIIEPIRRKQSRQARHTSDIRRNIDTEYQELEWISNDALSQGVTVILLDDIITSGASFKACQKIITEHWSDVNIIGVFWAVTVSNSY